MLLGILQPFTLNSGLHAFRQFSGCFSMISNNLYRARGVYRSSTDKMCLLKTRKMILLTRLFLIMPVLLHKINIELQSSCSLLQKKFVTVNSAVVVDVHPLFSQQLILRPFISLQILPILWDGWWWAVQPKIQSWALHTSVGKWSSSFSSFPCYCSVVQRAVSLY